MTGWSLLFWVSVTFLLLYPLNRWINTHVQGVAFLVTGSVSVAIWFFWVLFLPGTFLHELSHWLAAKLLGVKTSRFSVWPKQQGGGELQMGAVQVQVSDPFRHSLIGLAPLIFGSATVLIIGYGLLGLEQLGTAVLSGDLAMILQALTDLLSVPDIWLWVYLIFAISNAMLPSASDREEWYSALLFLGLAAILAIGLGFNPTIPEIIQTFSLYVLTYLLMAFVVTIVLDLLVMMLLFFTEWSLGIIMGRRIQYG
jgi:hypothetical protein